MAITTHLPPTEWLIKASQSCYDQYFSKKYRLTDREKFPTKGSVNGAVIERPNHGLAHTIRKMSFVPLVVAAFEQLGISTFKLNGAQLSLRSQIENMQIALLFSVTGRESEASYKDDPANYTLFRQNSAALYEAHVLANKGSYQAYQQLIQNHGVAFYKAVVLSPHGDKACIISRIFRISHCLDLQRCYSPAEFAGAMQSITTDLTVLGQSSAKVNTIANDLKAFATLALTSTGDQNLALGVGRQPELFVACSKDAKFCFSQIGKMQLPGFITTHSASSPYEQGKAFYTAGDFTKALTSFLSGARLGHDKSEFYTGYCFYYGKGTPINYEEAFKYLKASTKHADQAASHLPTAYHLVGLSYYNAQGCIKDPNKALAYLKKAAELNSQDAKDTLKKLFNTHKT